MKKEIIVIFLILSIFISGCGGNKMNNSKIKLETTQGNIVIELYEKEMPITAGNFKTLVQKYLGEADSSTSILDISCETGKNAACLVNWKFGKAGAPIFSPAKGDAEAAPC